MMGCAVLNCFGSIMSCTGTFEDPNQIFLQAFSFPSLSDILIQTWQYGGSGSAPGGTNGAGVVIPVGGFDSVVSVFGPDGTLIDYNDDGTCPPGTLDGENCFDSTLAINSLPAGTYTLALTVVGNYPAGVALSDGFVLAGDFGGRAQSYAVDISVTSENVVPEPSTFELFMGSIGLLAVVKLIATTREPTRDHKRVKHFN